MKGVELKTNPNNGYTVITCHYTADPLKDDIWLETEKKLYPNINAWKRMYEIDFAGLQGTPIYPTFIRDKHVKTLEHNPLSTIYRAWDFGVEVSACKFYQIDQWSRVLLLAEFVKNRVESFKRFTSEVVEFSSKRFEPIEIKGKLYPPEFQDFADYAGKFSSDGEGKMYMEILADFNINPFCSPFSKTTKDRAIEIMNRLLNEEVSVREGIKTPKFLVDSSCTVSIDGYAGGYVYDKRERPMSPNHPYEDVMDPDHYFLVNKMTLVEQKEEDEENTYPALSEITGYFV